MSWSGLQRETLEAMGFAVLLPRPVRGAAADLAADIAANGGVARIDAAHALPERALPASALSGRVSSERASPEHASTDRRAAATSSSHSAATAAQRAAPPVPDRLMRALLRAAGRAPDAVDAPVLLAQWPDPARLRRDPAAKRALWPQLRALRRAYS